MAHAVGGGADGHGQKVTAFQVGGGDAVGIPGRGEGGAGEPAPDGHVGTGEEQQSGPTHEDEAIALQPIIEDIKPSPIANATYCSCHRNKTSCLTRRLQALSWLSFLLSYALNKLLQPLKASSQIFPLRWDSWE